jgi:hypothetical protein
VSGRPRNDRLVLIERVAGELAADPTLSANQICRNIGGRRGDVLRAVKLLKSLGRSRRSG